MRVFERLPRWLPTGIFALVLLLAIVIPVRVSADTGTYQISNYIVTLEPQSNGQVKLSFEQTWKVLSGDIPWITVGLPNSSFSIQERGGASAKVSPTNSSGFSGVRIDLDKDYLPGQTFTVKFAVFQGNLLERLTSEKKWRINYTPGWYDNAITDHLQINLVSPVDLRAYSAIDPPPTSTANNTFTWEKSNIARGGKFMVKVECLDGSFLSETAQPVSTSSGPPGWVIVLTIGIIIVLIYLMIALAVRKNREVRDAELKARIASYEKEMAEDKAKKKEIEKGFDEYVEEKGIQPDEQGRYYDRGYGDYITPAIWAAVILSHGNQSNTPQPGSGGTSCACACVACACACACACAGGGAAGCSKKSLHQCDKCLKPKYIISSGKPTGFRD